MARDGQRQKREFSKCLPKTTLRKPRSKKSKNAHGLEDAFGNVVTSYHSKITWSLVPPSTPAGGILTGITNLMAKAGQATFSDLLLSLPDNATAATYTLQIAGPNLVPVQLNEDVTD